MLAGASQGLQHTGCRGAAVLICANEPGRGVQLGLAGMNSRGCRGRQPEVRSLSTGIQLAPLAIGLLWASLQKGVHCWKLALRAGHLVLPRLAGCLKVLLLGCRKGLLGICGLPYTPGRQHTLSSPPWGEVTVHSRCLSRLLLASDAGG